MAKKEYQTPWEIEQDSMEEKYRGNQTFNVKHRLISDATRQQVDFVISGLGRALDNYTGTICEIERDDFGSAADAKDEFVDRIRYEVKRLVEILIHETIY